MEVTLRPEANVLCIGDPLLLEAFGRRFDHTAARRFTYPYHQLDWPAVVSLYQGIVITPYQWSLRHKLTWYYGWDCASACVWDLSAVESVGELEAVEVKVREETA